MFKISGCQQGTCIRLITWRSWL